MAQVGAPIRVHDDESRALSDAASADVDAPSTLSEAATPSSPLAVQRAADEVNSNDDGAAPSPGATDVGATPTGKRRAVRTESSKEATVTLKDGRQLTLYRRQEFPSRAAAKEFIHDFALAQGKRARLDPHMSGGRNFVYICNSKTKCDFIVRGARLHRKSKGDANGAAGAASGGYYVTSFNADHGNECSGKTAITQRQVVNQLLRASEASSVLSASAAGSTSTILTGFDVQSIVKNVHGTTVPSRMAYRAKDALVVKALNDGASSIQKVESLLTHFQVLNPSASARIDMDPEHNFFERAFLKLPHANLVQHQGSARVLGFDYHEMNPSSSSYKGILLELATKDGNNDSYVLAVALCDTPTVANLTWFFECCVLGDIAFDVPIFCDRSVPAIQSALAKTFTAPPLLLQCTQHLLDSMDKMFPSNSLSKDWQKFVWQAQDADTQDDFEAAIVSLRMLNSKVGEYLVSVDPHTWAKYCYVRKYPLYGWQTTALTEDENHFANAARHLNPFECFQKYMEQSMNHVYVRKSNAAEWRDAGRVLTAYAEHVLEENQREAVSCCVSPSDRDSGAAYVWDTRKLNPKKRRVNISINSCSCAYPDQRRLPCKHLMAAIQYFNKSGASWDAQKLCHPVLYTVRAYYACYSQATAVQIPVEEELARNSAIKVKHVSTKRCSLCHAFGHNKRNCSNNSDANIRKSTL